MAEPAALPEAAEHHHLPDKRLLTFVGVMAAMFLSALDQTIVAVAMPTVIKELNGFDRIAWVTVVYLLTSTAVVPIVGKISEQLGRKRVFLTGIALFLVGSALSGAAQTMDQLILFRGFQGIGGGILTGTAFAIIADLFSPAERGKYTGLMVSVFGLASVVGPLVGGYLTDNVGWRWVFYVNLPIGLVVWSALFFTFPALRKGVGRPRIDYLGAAGISGGAALMVLGASLAGINDWSYPLVWPGILGGAALIAIAMWHEARTPEAVLPPALFKSSIFSLSMLVTFIFGALMFGAILYVPLFLQAVVGVTSTNSGLLMLPMMAGMMITAPAGGFLLSYTGRYRVQGIVGIAGVSAGMYLLSRLTVSSAQFEVARDMVVVGLGMGLSMPVFNVISQNAVPQRFVSSATSAIQFIRQMGATLGLAVLGAQFAQNYKHNLVSDIPAALMAQLPAPLRNALGNPQALADVLKQGQARAVDPAAQAVMKQLGLGVKMSLTGATVDIFLIAAILGAVAVVFTALIREIPLRKTLSHEPPAGVPDAPGVQVPQEAAVAHF